MVPPSVKLTLLILVSYFDVFSNVDTYYQKAVFGE
jgi:hypothetical protein